MRLIGRTIGLMRNPDSNARHVVDAVKVLDGLATGGAEAAGARFEITINLGADTERYSKSIAVDPNDIDPDDATGTLPAIAAIAMMGKSKGGGGGQGYL